MKDVVKKFINISVDMRLALRTNDLGKMKGLIEEYQNLGYKVEAALQDQKDLMRLQAELSKARREYKKLKREYEELYPKVKSKRTRKSE